jgi:riboflavin kinase/FMN adenylyltransferase
MSLLHYSLDRPVPAAAQGGVLALGNFDGVHRGHQALIAEAVRQAGALGAPAIAVTFDPHPYQVLRPSLFQPLLTTIAYRAELLQQYGADHVLVLETTPALLQLEAREFFERIIRGGLQARGLVEGYNFAFGRKRGGTIEVLQGFCRAAGLPLTLLPPQEVLGKPVSSSRVRHEILAGAMDMVQQLLGRPYRVAGTVGRGAGRGRTIGVPTANLEAMTLYPGDGVYAVKVWHADRAYAGAANVGPNPTFGEQARKLEVHLIDYQGDLYGQELAVDFWAKLRSTRAFRSVEELTAQIEADIAQARALPLTLAPQRHRGTEKTEGD